MAKPKQKSSSVAGAAAKLRQLANYLGQINAGHRIELTVHIDCRISTPEKPAEFESEPLISDSDAAVRLGVSVAHIRGLLRSGDLAGRICHSRGAWVYLSEISRFNFARSAEDDFSADPLYTMSEAAAYLKIDRKALYLLRQEGLIQDQQGPSSWPVIRFSSLEQYREQNP